MDSVQTLSQLTDSLGPVLENEPLKNHTTLGIGGGARFFYEAAHSDDLIKAVQTAEELNLKYFVLGGGSNVLVSDKGFDGLVIHAQNKNLRLQGEKIYVEAGVPNAEAARETVNAGLTGIEWLATIPGTVGGAIYGNAGCFGKSIKNAVSKVDVYRTGAKKRLLKKDCQFSYRDSMFKRNNDIILSAELALEPGEKQAGLKKIAEFMAQKKETQPLDKRSAGSIFKNYAFHQPQDIESIKAKCDIPPEFLAAKKIPAGWLLEQVGAKGMKVGDIEISDKHANYFINTGKGTATQFIELLDSVKAKVKDQLGVELHEEIQLIGF
ncbi:UDP-N-acetylmuramate dehydrogenase [Patescibacteria group bacterium]|nr:UDP-N-acetylmuramate dehydrogenase [Patescibacteria group bacterium]MBU1922223.1 UDP-N-acetylmuramate dehydrogenase [Patescibacteria group bacterium]